MSNTIIDIKEIEEEEETYDIGISYSCKKTIQIESYTEFFNLNSEPKDRISNEILHFSGKSKCLYMIICSQSIIFFNNLSQFFEMEQSNDYFELKFEKGTIKRALFTKDENFLVVQVENIINVFSIKDLFTSQSQSLCQEKQLFEMKSYLKFDVPSVFERYIDNIEYVDVNGNIIIWNTNTSNIYYLSIGKGTLSALVDLNQNDLFPQTIFSITNDIFGILFYSSHGHDDIYIYKSIEDLKVNKTITIISLMSIYNQSNNMKQNNILLISQVKYIEEMNIICLIVNNIESSVGIDGSKKTKSIERLGFYMNHIKNMSQDIFFIKLNDTLGYSPKVVYYSKEVYFHSSSSLYIKPPRFNIEYISLLHCVIVSNNQSHTCSYFQLEMSLEEVLIKKNYFEDDQQVCLPRSDLKSTVEKIVMNTVIGMKEVDFIFENRNKETKILIDSEEFKAGRVLLFLDNEGRIVIFDIFNKNAAECELINRKFEMIRQGKSNVKVEIKVKQDNLLKIKEREDIRNNIQSISHISNDKNNFSEKDKNNKLDDKNPINQSKTITNINNLYTISNSSNEIITNNVNSQLNPKVEVKQEIFEKEFEEVVVNYIEKVKFLSKETIEAMIQSNEKLVQLDFNLKIKSSYEELRNIIKFSNGETPEVRSKHDNMQESFLKSYKLFINIKDMYDTLTCLFQIENRSQISKKSYKEFIQRLNTMECIDYMDKIENLEDRLKLLSNESNENEVERFFKALEKFISLYDELNKRKGFYNSINYLLNSNTQLNYSGVLNTKDSQVNHGSNYMNYSLQNEVNRSMMTMNSSYSLSSEYSLYKNFLLEINQIFIDLNIDLYKSKNQIKPIKEKIDKESKAKKGFHLNLSSIYDCNFKNSRLIHQSNSLSNGENVSIYDKVRSIVDNNNNFNNKTTLFLLNNKKIEDNTSTSLQRIASRRQKIKEFLICKDTNPQKKEENVNQIKTSLVSMKNTVEIKSNQNKKKLHIPEDDICNYSFIENFMKVNEMVKYGNTTSLQKEEKKLNEKEDEIEKEKMEILKKEEKNKKVEEEIAKLKKEREELRKKVVKEEDVKVDCDLNQLSKEVNSVKNNIRKEGNKENNIGNTITNSNILNSNIQKESASVNNQRQENSVNIKQIEDKEKLNKKLSFNDSSLFMGEENKLNKNIESKSINNTNQTIPGSFLNNSHNDSINNIQNTSINLSSSTTKGQPPNQFAPLQSLPSNTNIQSNNPFSKMNQFSSAINNTINPPSQPQPQVQIQKPQIQPPQLNVELQPPQFQGQVLGQPPQVQGQSTSFVGFGQSGNLSSSLGNKSNFSFGNFGKKEENPNQSINNGLNTNSNTLNIISNQNMTHTGFSSVINNNKSGFGFNNVINNSTSNNGFPSGFGSISSNINNQNQNIQFGNTIIKKPNDDYDFFNK